MEVISNWRRWQRNRCQRVVYKEMSRYLKLCGSHVPEMARTQAEFTRPVKGRRWPFIEKLMFLEPSTSPVYHGEKVRFSLGMFMVSMSFMNPRLADIVEDNGTVWAFRKWSRRDGTTLANALRYLIQLEKEGSNAE